MRLTDTTRKAIPTRGARLRPAAHPRGTGLSRTAHSPGAGREHAARPRGAALDREARSPDARLRALAVEAGARVSFGHLKTVLIFVACGVAVWAGGARGAAQGGARGGVAPGARAETAGGDDKFVERAAAAVCVERELDPRGSTPIDVMQARPSLPTRHPEALAGARRADLLLAEAKQLTGEALLGLMREHKVAPSARRAALRRVALVRRVRPDVELRDNASVFFDDPRTIRFGTLFLAGLRSDEGVLSVLAHELVHVADGPGGALSDLFRRVGRRASAHAGRLPARRAEELTCDLVGVRAVRLYVARNSSEEPLARRAARAVEHNCVERDETDSSHLSPRETLRALLALDPDFAAEITGEAGPQPATAAPLNHVRTPTPAPTPPRF
jgi:hypothetical protein